LLLRRDDIYAEDSIELLKNSGIDFERFEREGIDIQYFGEVLMMSGLVLNKEVKWLTFHSSYDFGYLIKTLTGTDLPADETSFLEILHLYFPCSYDLKVSILCLLDVSPCGSIPLFSIELALLICL
jgi:CCR4-NOT transcription complex subunit 7/8